MRVIAFLLAMTFMSAAAVAEGMCSYQTAKTSQTVATDAQQSTAPNS
jgi:hypothetical protein